MIQQTRENQVPFDKKKQGTKFIFLNIDFPYTFLNVNFIDPERLS